MKAECEAAGIPYFFKQIDKVQEIPDDLLIREYPDEVFAIAQNACGGCASKSEIFTKGFII